MIYQRYFKPLFCIVLVMIPILVSGQSKHTQDVIYLKNGSVLRGEILQNNEQEKIKIRITGNNVFVIPADEIENITTERIPGSKNFKDSGYMNLTGVNFAPGRFGSTIRLQMVNGFQINPNFSIGIGVGYSAYDDPINTIPVFVDLKFKALKANFTPFAYVKAGYNFTVIGNGSENSSNRIESHYGGTTVDAGVGLQFDFSQAMGWYITAGYLADNLTYKEKMGIRNIETDVSYRRLIIGLGITF